MSRYAAAVAAAAAAAAALAIATLGCGLFTSATAFSHMHTVDRVLGILSRRTDTSRSSRSPNSGDGFSWARRKSAWTTASTSSSKFPERIPNQQQSGELRMSLDDGGGEGNALLLRMDFEHAEVEGLREWIRR